MPRTMVAPAPTTWATMRPANEIQAERTLSFFFFFFFSAAAPPRPPPASGADGDARRGSGWRAVRSLAVHLRRILYFDESPRRSMSGMPTTRRRYLHLTYRRSAECRYRHAAKLSPVGTHACCQIRSGRSDCLLPAGLPMNCHNSAPQRQRVAGSCAKTRCRQIEPVVARGLKS